MEFHQGGFVSEEFATPEAQALDTRLTESGDSRDAAELLINRRAETEPQTVEVQYNKQDERGQPVHDPDTGRFVPSPDNTDISPEKAADDVRDWRQS
jgi:hypothetical protein